MKRTNKKIERPQRIPSTKILLLNIYTSIILLSLAFSFYSLPPTHYLLSPSPAYAAGSDQCQPVYGGGQTCIQSGTISINKTVQNPQTGSFVENLGATNPRYSPDQTISFQITIKNNSNNNFTNVVVKDLFPQQYVTFSSGPGQFDSNSNILTFVIAKLNANQTQTFTIKGKITNQMPTNQNLVCVVNQAQVTGNNQTSQDNTQFCIQPTIPTDYSLPTTPSSATTTKGGLPIFKSTTSKRTPSTGPEDLALFSLLPTGALGYLLRKKTNK